MRRFQKTAIAILFALSLAPSHAAAFTGIGVGPSVGSDGIGADLFLKPSPFLMLRGGYRYAALDINREIDDIDYDLDVGFSSGVIAADIHPLANGLRVSGGVYLGGRNIELTAMPASPVTIGDQTFTPPEIGVINGVSDWSNAAPFIGIGFNNGANALKRFGFQALIGAMYIGEPDVTLDATGGLLANDPDFLAELDEEERRIEEDLNDFPVLPILSLGMTVRF